MTFTSLITGTGSFVPETILDNHELSRMVDTSDEWIVSRTGIRQRRIAREHTILDMALAAVRQAMKMAGVTPDGVDMILATTSTATRCFPALACDVQWKLGAVNAVGFDIASSACTGFVYAMDIARRYIQTGVAKTIVIVASEKLSDITDYADRTTCILFGDGAGAVVVQASQGEQGILGTYIASQGDGGAAISKSDRGYIVMNGHDVFKFAVTVMPRAIDKVLEGTGLTPKDLDFVIPHQANIRIIESVMHKHGFDRDKMVINIDRYGNTSSATIPLALDEMNRAGRLKTGDKLVFVAFGAGLTYGATLCEWKETH